MIRAKECKPCRMTWQTQRKTCPRCNQRFPDDAAFTIKRGVATRDTQGADPLLAAIDALIEWDAATPSYHPEALDPLPGLIEDIRKARQEKGA